MTFYLGTGTGNGPCECEWGKERFTGRCLTHDVDLIRSKNFDRYDYRCPLSHVWPPKPKEQENA